MKAASLRPTTSQWSVEVIQSYWNMAKRLGRYAQPANPAVRLYDSREADSFLVMLYTRECRQLRWTSWRRGGTNCSPKSIGLRPGIVPHDLPSTLYLHILQAIASRVGKGIYSSTLCRAHSGKVDDLNLEYLLSMSRD
jgi:hypothetical protein